MKRTLLRNMFSDSGQPKNYKEVESQVDLFEKHYPNLKSELKKYFDKKKTEKKCLEKIVFILQEYAKEETSSTKSQLEKFTKTIDDITQHLGSLVEELEGLVLENLTRLKSQSKHLRNDLKEAVSAAETERIRQRQLQRLQLLREHQQDRISAAEADLLKAKAENAKASRALEEHADLFNERKLSGLQSTLLSWTTTELRIHARSLELYTDAYNILSEIDVTADTQEFRERLRSNKTSYKLTSVDEATRRIEGMLCEKTRQAGGFGSHRSNSSGDFVRTNHRRSPHHLSSH